MTAENDHLYFTYAPAHAQSGRRLGFYRATLRADGTVSKVEDFTGDLPFALPVSVRVAQTGNGRELLFCSRGNGLWGRSLEER